jgi:hypothetical protein
VVTSSKDFTGFSRNIRLKPDLSWTPDPPAKAGGNLKNLSVTALDAPATRTAQ